MAVTSIWPVKSRLDHVINYARNPAKTRERSLVAQASLHAIDNVIEYAADTIKTEERAYVSCLNCREDDAAAQMMETKRYWGKPDGRLCFHGYQSFAEGEVTAETAHAIGVELAEELWGERFEVVIATHCNTGHYHNHFVINSVSWADGYKFNNSKSDYAEMRKISDRLCREHAISVIDVPSGKGKHYAQWSAEKNGKPTYRSMIRADINRAIRASTTERDFIRIMQEMGYELKTRGKSGEPLKYPAIKPPDAKGYFRFHKLGEEYSLDAIKDRILDNISKQYPFPAVEHHAPRKYRVRGNVRRSVTGLQALYFRYCYELHILVKHPTSVKRVSFLLKEDVTKLDRLDAQTRLLARNHIRTGEDLSAYQSNVEAAVQVYGDNVIEKHGINRDRTGDREKTRYLCGKQGIFTRDRALIRPGFIRQLETRASTRSASFFHALGSPGRPHNGGGAAGAYRTRNGAKPLKQGHLRAKRGPLGPSRKSQQRTKRTGFAAHGHSIAETAPEGKRASRANGALIRA